MITQLKWLKERAENHDLPLPVDPNYLATIRYIYTDGELCRHASAPEKAWQEVEVPQKKIISIAKKGCLLYKDLYKPYTLRCIDGLINILKTAPRTLSIYEQVFINELEQIRYSLTNNIITPPLGNTRKQYPNYLKVDKYNPTISDLENGKFLIKLVSNIIQNGVRPDSWLTPEAADRETTDLVN